jgi:MICOS complex subunit MIC26
MLTRDPQIPDRKPIYPTASPYVTRKLTTKPTASEPTLQLAPGETTQNSPPPGPTPTDRLASQIKVLRLHLYNGSLATENAFNDLLTYAFRQETRLADTIASLAPSPQTGEKLLPGAIYVLVATLAGSIVTRNRNILLRATVPLGVGIAAGWALIPVTMRNVGDLVWEYEKEVPVIADSHLAIRDAALQAWKATVRETKGVAEKVDSATDRGRQALEGWVEKGK